MDKTQDIKKILIIRLTSLGDVIFTLPLACTLKDNIENVQIGWVVAEKGLEVIKNNPCVRNVHFVPLKEWKKRPFSLKTLKEFIKIIKEIRNQNYDIAFDCQQMFKSLFLFWFSGAKRRITFKDARELSSLGGNEFVLPKAKFCDFHYHIVERNLDFARHIGINPKDIKFSLPIPSKKSINKIDELLEGLDSKPIVVLAPATTWANKHWDEKNWAKIVDEIHTRCNIIFTGTNADRELLAKILSYTKNENIQYRDLLGKTSVEELRELFTRAKIVISPDSGSAHLAWASQIPAVIAVFTCTPPKRFGPYDKGGEKYFSISGARNLANPAEPLSLLPCQPCFKKKCKRKADKDLCKMSPDPNEILNIVNKLLQ